MAWFVDESRRWPDGLWESMTTDLTRLVSWESVAVSDSRKSSPQEIADILRERIRGGELEAGERLPTQAELTEEFGMEPSTVRQVALSVSPDTGCRSAETPPSVGGE